MTLADIARPERAGAPLEISLFGPIDVRLAGQPLSRLRSAKGHGVLALLLLRHGREVQRDWLAGLLWPDSPVGRSNLRTTLADLRRALGPERFRIVSPSPQTLRFDLAGAEVDVFTFDHAIARGDPDALARAVALYRGPLLEGCAEEWVFQERDPREHAYLAALERLAAHARTQDDPGLAVDYLRRALAADPMRETAHRALMDALAAGGSYAEALLTYRELRARLLEIHAEPDPATTALYQRIRADASQRARSGRSPAARPASRVASPPASPSRRLPCPLTSLVGREREIEEVAQLLAHARLVTLTGAGGIGKTRLAIRAAEDLAGNYPEGVGFVDLTSVSDPALVVQTAAAALEVRETPGQPLLQTLRDFLQRKSLLLVLDNCEHLVAACAALAGSLLRDCPDLRILATSRQRLGLPGEKVWRTPSLSLPETEPESPAEGRSREGKCRWDARRLEDMARSEAARLFLERARDVRPSFSPGSGDAAALLHICRRLDGIPLAIEMAAALVRMLSPEQIAARLDDRFRLLGIAYRADLPRRQALRAAFDWSFDLLSPEEQALLRRLSVFAGGWTLEAAQAVCTGEGDEEWDLLGRLTRLVDQSLVEVREAGKGAPRYRLLETVREYSRERLQESGEMAAMRARHREWCRALADEARPHLRGPDQREWLDRLETEHGNLRAALDGCDSGEDGAMIGLQLAGALWPFWERCGYLREGRERLSQALAKAGAHAPAADRAWARGGAGFMALLQGDLAAAREQYGESLRLYREPGNQRGIAGALKGLGMVAWRRDDMAAACAYYEESLAIFRELGDRAGIAGLLSSLGNAARGQGDLAAARSLLEESLGIERQGGNSYTVALGLNNLGLVLLDQGDDDGARACFEEGLGWYREIGHKGGIAWSLQNVGLVAARRGDHGAARHFLTESLALFREAGESPRIAWTLDQLGEWALSSGDFREAYGFFRESVSLWKALDNPPEVLGCLEGLAEILTVMGQPRRAASLLGAVDALRQALSIPRPAPYHADWDRSVAAARGALGEGAFASAWEQGRSMSLDQAIASAPVALDLPWEVLPNLATPA